MRRRQAQVLLVQTDTMTSRVANLTTAPISRAYTPYGYVPAKGESTLGFQGQWLDDWTHTYALGNGQRVYSPILMRFISPDVLSPFDKGWLNAYAYCEGDPVNYNDNSGFGKTGPKTGLTAQLKQNSISPAFKPLIKAAFKDLSRQDLHVEFGMAFNVHRNSSGQFTVTPSKGNAALTAEIAKAHVQIQRLEIELAKAQLSSPRSSQPNDFTGPTETNPAVPPRPAKPSELIPPLVPAPAHPPAVPPRGSGRASSPIVRFRQAQ
ncbi:MAG: RHS repeat-associated core domain-containing protein [Pseudomonas sp.]